MFSDFYAAAVQAISTFSFGYQSAQDQLVLPANCPSPFDDSTEFCRTGMTHFWKWNLTFQLLQI
jgi:hypothetical protein